MTKLKQSLESDGGILEHSYERSDGHGRNSRLCIWSHPGEDITGMLAKSEKVVTTSEEVRNNLYVCVTIAIGTVFAVCMLAAIGI